MAEDVTLLLEQYRHGDKSAGEQLLEAVYGELKRIARAQLRHRSRDQTLQPTALVNEAYLKLDAAASKNWMNRKHFYRVAANAMRQVVVDHARAHAALKRGGDLPTLPIDEVVVCTGEARDKILALDQVLDQLRAVDEQTYQVVQLRFFCGLTVDETAEAIGVSSRTVKRDWRFGRAWLRSALGGEVPPHTANRP